MCSTDIVCVYYPLQVCVYYPSQAGEGRAEAGVCVRVCSDRSSRGVWPALQVGSTVGHTERYMHSLHGDGWLFLWGEEMRSSPEDCLIRGTVID